MSATDVGIATSAVPYGTCCFNDRGPQLRRELTEGFIVQAPRIFGGQARREGTKPF